VLFPLINFFSVSSYVPTEIKISKTKKGDELKLTALNIIFPLSGG